MTTRATSGRNCPRRTPSTGADTPAIAVFSTASRARVKSSTSRSGFCMRAARTSKSPWPSTRTLACCGACVIATLEITEAKAAAPDGSCVWASAGLVANATLARIRPLDRRAGQFIFIAVLLDWSKFACSLDAPPVFRRHPYPFRGTKRHPWRFFPPARHTVGRLRAKNRCAIVDWKPPRSYRWEPSRLRRGARCSPADLLCRGARPFHPLHFYRGRSAIRTDRAAQPLFLTLLAVWGRSLARKLSLLFSWPFSLLVLPERWLAAGQAPSPLASRLAARPSSRPLALEQVPKFSPEFCRRVLQVREPQAAARLSPSQATRPSSWPCWPARAGSVRLPPAKS